MKRNAFTDAVIFIAGVSVGFVLARLYSDWKDQMAKENQSESQTRAVIAQCVGVRNPNGANDVDNSGSGKIAYSKVYKPESASPENAEKEDNAEAESDAVVHVISPDEYSESDYTVEELTWFDDEHVLVDCYSQEVNQDEYFPGIDLSEHFGEYEEDVVYLRNDKIELDYCVVKDFRSYSDFRTLVPKNIINYEEQNE